MIIKYNLDAQFARLSTKRISSMVNLRIKKESQIAEDIFKLEMKQEKCFSDEYYDTLQAKIEKLRVAQDDVCDWMNSAKPLFSTELWNETVNHNECWAA